jgi:predicted DNA-binding transcriptional regulator AlpA
MNRLRDKEQAARLVEVAEFLGVTKQCAHQIAAEPGFPTPLAEDVHGRVWSRHEVQAWGKVVAGREALAVT